jgi:hypothetical protein
MTAQALFLPHSSRSASFDIGSSVQVKSGGAPMTYLGSDQNGDAKCALAGRTYSIPCQLLQTVRPDPRPVRRGRPPRPTYLDWHPSLF